MIAAANLSSKSTFANVSVGQQFRTDSGRLFVRVPARNGNNAVCLDAMITDTRCQWLPCEAGQAWSFDDNLVVSEIASMPTRQKLGLTVVDLTVQEARQLADTLGQYGGSLEERIANAIKDELES